MKKIIILMFVLTSIMIISGCKKKTTELTHPGAVFKKDSYDIIGEKDYQFKFHYHSRDEYVFDNNFPTFLKAKELTKVTLINTANSTATNSLEQFNLQATQQFPADIYGGNNLAFQFMKYGMEGAFFDLTRFMDDGLMPNLKKLLDDNPDIRKAITAPDGGIYYLPYIPDGGVARTYWIQTQWLKNLNLQMPQTVQELEVVLKEFRDKDANLNGRTNDEIPYFNEKPQEIIRLANLFGARVFGNDSYSERYIPDGTGKLYHAWTQEAFRNAIREVSRWYDEGLIDKEYLTVGDQARKQYLGKDIGGMTHEWVASTSGFNDTVGVKNFKFEVMLPPVGTNGKRWEEHERILVKPDGWAISHNCKDADVVAQYFDFWYSEAGRNLSNFGVEGQHWDLVNGKPQFKESVLKNSEKLPINTYLTEKVGAQLNIGYYQDYEYERQWTNAIGLAGVEKYKDNAYGVSQLPVLVFTSEEIEIRDTYLANINAYMDETVHTWIINDYRLITDEAFDQFVKTCYQLGLAKLDKIYQDAYQRYLNNQN